MPVVNGAAVTILFTQNDAAPAIVRILNSSFTFNSEYYAGAMIILSFNSSIASQTIIDGSYFENNFIKESCDGAAISANLYFDRRNITKPYRPLVITNSRFSNNGFGDVESNWTTGAIKLEAYKHINAGFKTDNEVVIAFYNLTFTLNTAPSYGTCLYAISNTFPDRSRSNFLTIHFDSIVAYNNPNLTVKELIGNFRPASLFSFNNINQTFINGTVNEPGKFLHNYGSVFELSRSLAILDGTLIFNENIANHGAAFSLLLGSVIYLKKGLRADFSHNTVQSLGGAIYSMSGNNKEAKCTFQLYHAEDYKNISLTFKNNSATLAGNSIYSPTLYGCDWEEIFPRPHDNVVIEMYNTMFKNVLPGDIASDAKYLDFCEGKTTGMHEIHPGGSIHVPIRVIDPNQSMTHEILTVIPVEKGNFLKKINWWYSDYQGSFVIKGKNNCTTLNLTIHTTDVATLDKESMLLFSVSRRNKIVKVSVKLKSCPPGFRLSTTGSCVCSDLFKKFINQQVTCDIESNSFIKHTDFNVWMGNSTKSNNFSIAYCHPSYCNFGSQLNLIYLNSSGSYLGSTNSTISLPLCYGSRTGDACGECIPNYSVVFGSTECKDCSSSFWPFTILLYIIAGPLLVLLLYTLKLTLTTGTLNGIIFYAQIVNIGIIHYLNVPCNEKIRYPVRFVSVFISWLNLNLGFPLCFFNGMTEILKAGLSLLFPVYLILIVGLLIILSRYSVTVSNRFSRSSIQVLVTVVHLSFTKLLQSVLDVFSSAKIYTEGVDVPKTIWYNNGAIMYDSKSHVWLMVMTSIVAGLILVPYFIIILLGKFLLKFDRFRECIRPFYEAIHAPYRRNKWYWFALHQLFVLLTYVSETFSSDQQRRVLFLSLILIYHILIYLHTKSTPFRYKTLNWLNLMILLALNFVFLVSQYIYLSNGSPKQLVMFFAIANYPIIAAFMMIIAYHILLVTNKVNWVLLLYQNVKERFPGFKETRQYNQRRRPYYGCSDSGDYTEAREPLLEQTLIN
uniref:Uncharacterized protein n=1 Tax=Amphimedon queenslandica TaxID=400682 RepID=A0A1X7TK62_AMPQE